MSSNSLPHPLVSSEWLHQNIDMPNLVILDATIKKATSEGDDYFKGLQIPKARFIDIKGNFSDSQSAMPNTLPSPKAFTEAAQALGINKDSKIIVYDRLGIYAAPRVWWMFRAMGHEHIAVLDGGLPAWISEGFKTEASKTKTYESGDFIANFQDEMVVGLEEVLQNITTKRHSVLDARSSGRFHGTAPEPRADVKGGHIPNSINLPYTELLQDGKMKQVEELRAIFKSLKLPNTPRIYSCGTGITACIIMLAAALTGFSDHAIYDGSWTEWGQAEHVPIAT
ncbi:sulfurtransferase [Sungkyunkwania multivorans]|uniref:Sulfurtransferase n=1 Tax=Sungkyunkwania multivorans TaxID=1173618 RepID=A0ABW3D053_9FLAO